MKYKKSGTTASYLFIVSLLASLQSTGTTWAAWKNLCPDNIACISNIASTQDIPAPPVIHVGVHLSFVYRPPFRTANRSTDLRAAHLFLYGEHAAIRVPTPFTTNNRFFASLLQLPSGNWVNANIGKIETWDSEGNLLNTHPFPSENPLNSGIRGWQQVGPAFYKDGTIYFGRNRYGGYNFNFTVSHDNGLSWETLTPRITSDRTSFTPLPAFLDQFVNNPFAAGFYFLSKDVVTFRHERISFAHLYQVTEGGKRFELINDLKFFTDNDNQLNYIMPDPTPDNPDEQVLYGATNRGLYISRDGGRNWSVLNASLGAFHRIAVVHNHKPKLLLASTTQGLEVSRDGGLHWSLFEKGMYKDIQQIFYLNGVLLARNSAGWYQCADFACDGEATPIPDMTKRGEVKVVEFYHAELDHYFITSDPEEIAGIDNGSAGAGWTRTGHEFTAWTAFGHPDKIGIGKAVCRFYGSQSPGPNSHFFSASASECELLHSLQKTTADHKPRWNFESLAFNVEIVDAETGACRSGRIPIYRAYNNGFVRGKDSNHRFVPDHTEIDKLVAQGWIDEGIAFCVAP